MAPVCPKPGRKWRRGRGGLWPAAEGVRGETRGRSTPFDPAQFLRDFHAHLALRPCDCRFGALAGCDAC
jgi:hypothetical protein